MCKLKITCYTPPNKASTAIKTFGRYFSVIDKPIESKLVGPAEFYYIYQYKNRKACNKVISHKIPKAEQSIRNTYMLIIHLVDRANKLAKDGAWKVEKMRQWMMKQLRKKVSDPKSYEDFVNAVETTDKDEMMKFLAGELFRVEEIS